MIELFYETDFEITEAQQWINWVVESMKNEGKTIEELNYIFCDDEYLLEINKQYLDHDYYTDVIGFDNSVEDELMGDIFISVERIKDNAEQNGVSFENELARIMMHGILHFAGYLDKDPEDKELMTSKEDQYLATFSLLKA
ncbi:rRNA maturation RNase YbeY [Chishuiella changwenlii]|uniref:Endoribonuclease YbeY n=1 Tax=Chishuiella changwenlii TaxID=1434701 RepID=A0A1M6YT19_9FLAO|nr:rRNA maturation RNase YbeY [Chishuiella changwenlii]GGE88343.1 endoribonuclease YbeY [Chishuiella changwenlii]SHL21233.1 rRNA maturation RNase YbeY [Chishuiella changwenlii]